MIQISTHDNLAFLRQLSTDDLLRAALSADPAGTLRRHGIAFDPSSLPREIVLPAKEALGAEVARSRSLAGIQHVPWAHVAN